LQGVYFFAAREPSPPENHTADFPLGWAVTLCRFAAIDALHLAAASLFGCDVVLSLNCRRRALITERPSVAAGGRLRFREGENRYAKLGVAVPLSSVN
jgi:hypothetical protein